MHTEGHYQSLRQQSCSQPAWGKWNSTKKMYWYKGEVFLGVKYNEYQLAKLRSKIIILGW